MSQSRSRTGVLLLALLLGLVISATLQARNEVTLVPAFPLVDEDYKIIIDGTWFNGCGPEVDRVVRSEADLIQIWLRPNDNPGVACTQAFTDYTLSISSEQIPSRLGPGIYRLEVIIMGYGNEDRVNGFRLFELRDPLDTREFAPESGAWWPEAGGRFNTSGPGSGVSVDAQNGVINAIFHVYDERGDQQWLWAAGHWEGQVFRAELFHTSQGQPLFGSYRPPEQVEPMGMLDMHILSPSRAEAFISRADDSELIATVELVAMSLTRFLFAVAPDENTWLDEWLLVSGSGDVQRFTLDSILESDKNGFLLADTLQGYALGCLRQPERPETLPQRCELSNADDGDVIIFDRIGHDRSEGLQGDQEAQLIRLRRGGSARARSN